MIEGSGNFKMNRKLVQYATEWSSTQFRFSMGKFTGMTWGPDTAVGDPANVLFFAYNSKGGYFLGGDSTMDDMTNKIRGEFDDKKRLALVQDFQRYNAGKMFNEKIGVAGGEPRVRGLGHRNGPLRRLQHIGVERAPPLHGGEMRLPFGAGQFDQLVFLDDFIGGCFVRIVQEVAQ